MKKLICIACPVGCHLLVDDQLHVEGNKCIRGEKYAIEELTHPTRILTTTIKTTSVTTPRLSVKTKDPIPKELIFDVLHLLEGLIIDKDVKIGDVVIHDILNTGIDLVATKSVTINPFH